MGLTQFFVIFLLLFLKHNFDFFRFNNITFTNCHALLNPYESKIIFLLKCRVYYLNFNRFLFSIYSIIDILTITGQKKALKICSLVIFKIFFILTVLLHSCSSNVGVLIK